MSIPPFRSKKTLKLAACRFLLCHNPQGFYPLDMERIVEIDLNMRFLLLDDISHYYTAPLYVACDQKTIVVENDFYRNPKKKKKLRFWLAYGCASTILHGDLFRALNIHSHDQYLFYLINLPDKAISRFSFQAAYLAGQILAPSREIWLQVDQVTNFSSIAGHLARYFGVSEEFIRFRLRQENLGNL